MFALSFGIRVDRTWPEIGLVGAKLATITVISARSTKQGNIFLSAFSLSQIVGLDQANLSYERTTTSGEQEFAQVKVTKSSLVHGRRSLRPRERDIKAEGGYDKEREFRDSE
jgi:hypothetical protein